VLALRELLEAPSGQEIAMVCRHTPPAAQPPVEMHGRRGGSLCAEFNFSPLCAFAALLLAHKEAAAFKPPSLGAGSSPAIAGYSLVLAGSRSASLNGHKCSVALVDDGVIPKKDQPDKLASLEKPIFVPKHPSEDKNLGRPHTLESRMKISKANKGKTPWNVGKAHSSATKDRIREGMKRAAEKAAERKRLERERLQREEPETYAKILAQEEAREKLNKAKKDERNRQLRQKKAEEKQRKIDEARREKERLKLEKPDEYAALVAREQAKAHEKKARIRAKRNYTVSEETKRKIAASVKKSWQNETYRALQANKTVSAETRAKLSRIIKEKWQNQTFRDRFSPGGSHSAERRAKIAASIRAKWSDPEYREKTVAAIRNRTFNCSGRAISLATRRKIAQKMRLKWRDTSFRVNRTEAIFNHHRRAKSRVKTRLERRLKKRRMKKKRRPQHVFDYSFGAKDFSDMGANDIILRRREMMLSQRSYFSD